MRTFKLRGRVLFQCVDNNAMINWCCLNRRGMVLNSPLHYILISVNLVIFTIPESQYKLRCSLYF